MRRKDAVFRSIVKSATKNIKMARKCTVKMPRWNGRNLKRAPKFGLKRKKTNTHTHIPWNRMKYVCLICVKVEQIYQHFKLKQQVWQCCGYIHQHLTRISFAIASLQSLGNVPKREKKKLSSLDKLQVVFSSIMFICLTAHNQLK